MIWFTFILSVLAVFRIAILISEDSGPGHVFRKARQSVPRKSSFWEGIRCFRCCSVWAASGVTASLWWLGAVPGVLTMLYGLALSGAAIALNRVAPET